MKDADSTGKGMWEDRLRDGRDSGLTRTSESRGGEQRTQKDRESLGASVGPTGKEGPCPVGVPARRRKPPTSAVTPASVGPEE